MVVDPKTVREKIKELNNQLAPLKEQREKLKNEASQWMEKRDETREKIKELRDEITNIKRQRDEINQKVKDLKVIRDQLVLERKEKLAAVVQLKQKIASYKQVPSKAVQAIQNEIESLDWKIQTSSLTLQQEKRIIERIAELEKQLASYKQAQAIRTEINTLQQQLRTLRTQEKEYHRQIAQLSEQSRQLTKTMTEKGANIPLLKTEAEEAHKKYIETRKLAQKLYQQYLPLIAQIRALLTQIKSEEEKKKTKRHMELLQELEKKALEKMKRGEKLTWEEFKILTEKGLV